MVKISINLPDNFNEEIKVLNIDITRIAEDSIREEIAKLIALRTIASRSNLTENDSLELGRKLKRGREEFFKERGQI
ncbi:hypothetical protein COU57_04455 [Candidatus Pacearchaeota archaeon CG10_big_fil_rev_8_21_14_0_10_32_14]|nr:MAG: hypothetical protein COU57_04455 [Candidatus Pacearchaeota archaeon CG10_big_fil_rev_8_21_14_0_10_32_14]